MMRALWAGVTGLQAHQVAMDTEGDRGSGIQLSQDHSPARRGESACPKQEAQRASCGGTGHEAPNG